MDIFILTETDLREFAGDKLTYNEFSERITELRCVNGKHPLNKLITDQLNLD